MPDLDGKTISVGTLLSQDFFFRVPEYQRPFSWETDHFDDLVDDIVSAQRDREYFLGTIVLHETQHRHYDVVDGQQRLTSLLILLACIRDLIDSAPHKQALQAKILQAENVVDGIPQQVRLEVKDRTIFNDLVVTPGGTLTELDARTLPEPEWRYATAVSVFTSKLSALSQEELEALTQFISQKCVVIYLATTEFDNAFRLFTIVNDRGKQLRRIDVLKAMNIAPTVIARDPIRNRIAREWEEHETELGESVFEGVFHLVRLILLKDKPQGDLLKEFESRVFGRSLVQMASRSQISSSRMPSSTLRCFRIGRFCPPNMMTQIDFVGSCTSWTRSSRRLSGGLVSCLSPRSLGRNCSTHLHSGWRRSTWRIGSRASGRTNDMPNTHASWA